MFLLSHRRSIHLHFCSVVCSFFIFIAAHAEEKTHKLPSVTVLSSASEFLLEDPLGVGKKIFYSQRSSQGSTVDQFSRVLPFQFSQLGSVGGASQWVGLGRTASETNVQFLDVPLNPGQGGGFDFQSLPGFLWHEARFFSGNQIGVFDPKTSAGTVLLKPWTQNALTVGDSVRMTSLVSSLDFRQFSAGISVKGSAFLMGANEGRIEGPGASFSQLIEVNSFTQVQFHLLGADIKTKPTGSDRFPSPDARQFQTRLIPSLSLNQQLENSSQWRISIFADHQVLKYENPGVIETRDQTRQLGLQTAWNDKNLWKVSFNFRRIFYNSSALVHVNEDQSHGFLEYLPETGNFKFQTKLGMQFVTDYELNPLASVGFVHLPTGVYSRVSFSRRFPSFIDRFYSVPGALSNPGLRPENIISFENGSEFNLFNVKNEFDLWIQGRNQSQVSVYKNSSFQMINLGRDFTISPVLTQSISPFGWLMLRHSISYKQTLNQKGAVDIINFTAQTEDPRYLRSKAGIDFRSQTRFIQKKTPSIPGHSVLDFEYSIEPTLGLQIFFRLENLMDRQIQWNPGYILPGRSLAAGMQWRT